MDECHTVCHDGASGEDAVCISYLAICQTETQERSSWLAFFLRLHCLSFSTVHCYSPPGMMPSERIEDSFLAAPKIIQELGVSLVDQFVGRLALDSQFAMSVLGSRE